MDMITSTDATIAVIQTDIAYIKGNIEDIKTVLKDGYATKDSLNEIARQVEIRLTILERSAGFWKWASPTLSAIIAVIIEFLFVNYLQHLPK